MENDLLFGTQTLTRVVNSLDVPEHDLLKNIATTEIQFETEEIIFDKAHPKQGLAPFSLPTVKAPLVEERGYETSSLAPAYIKLRTPCDIHRAFRRQAGEPIGGSMTPRARSMMAMNNVLMDHKDMWMTRLEWMLANMLVHGGYAVYGDDYPLQLLDFERPRSNDVLLRGNDAWNHGDSDVSDFLQDWSSLFAKNGGGALTDLIMGVGAWKAFRNNSSVEKRFDWASNPSNMTNINTGAMRRRGMKFKGTYEGEFNVYVYQDWYLSDGVEYERDRVSTSDTYGQLIKVSDVEVGTKRPFIPINGVIGLDPTALLATRAYGAIKDENFLKGMTALPLASRSWVPDDPAIRTVMTQSAPLIFPYRARAAAYADVYDTTLP